MARNRFANSLDAVTIYPTAQKLSKTLPGILSRYDFPELTRSELNQLTRDITDAFGGTWRGMWDDITDQLVEMATIESEAVAGVYNDNAPEKFVAPLASKVKTSASAAYMTLKSDVSRTGPWSQFVRDNLNATTRALAGAIRDGYNNGTSLGDLIKQIRGSKGADGIYRGGILNNKTRAQAATLARTGTSHYSNVARDEFAEKNKKIIQGRILFATLDNNTTTVCSGRHLNFYKTGGPFPPLPFHHNERSQYIFKTKGFDPLNTTRPSVQGKHGEDKTELFEEKQGRAKKRVTYRGKKSEDLFDIEMVDAKTTADDFLRAQPRWFIESTLGRERAKLFIDGDLKIDKFNDLTGRQLTLAELRETAAGERAYRKANK